MIRVSRVPNANASTRRRAATQQSEAKATKRAGKRAGRGAGGAEQPAKATRAAKAGGGILLQDILTVKDLVVRFGPGPLHTLIDAFAK